MEKNTQPQRDAARAHPEPNGAGHCAAAAQRDGPQRQLYGQAAGRNGKARAGRRRFVAQAENRGRCNAHRRGLFGTRQKENCIYFNLFLLTFGDFNSIISASNSERSVESPTDSTLLFFCSS